MTTPAESKTEWTRLDFEDLRAWASEVGRVLREANPHLLVREQRGILDPRSVQGLVVGIKAVGASSPHPAWRMWSTMLVTSILQVEHETGGSGACLVENTLDTILRSRSLSELKEHTRDTQPTYLSKRQVRQEEFFFWIETHGLSLGLSRDVVLAVQEAFRVSGPKTKILVGVGPGSTKVQVTKERGGGWKFTQGVQVSGITSPWTRSGAKVLLVDGIIETVASLDRLLTAANETMCPVLLVARGMGEEVLATLVTNLLHKTLDILPVTLDPGNLESLNLIADLGVCTGTVPVTPLTGGLFSDLEFENLPAIPRVQVLPDPGTIWVENPLAVPSVSSHVKTLQDRLQGQIASEDIVTLLESRIKTLTSDTVKILLPGGRLTSTESGTTRGHIDTLLRSAKAILTWGVVTTPPSPSPSPSPTTSGRGHSRTEWHFADTQTLRPWLGSFLGLSVSKSLLDTLASVSGFVTRKRGGSETLGEDLSENRESEHRILQERLG